VNSYRHGADLYINKDRVDWKRFPAYVRTFLSRLPYREEKAGQLSIGHIQFDRFRRSLKIGDIIYKDIPRRQYDLLYLIACGRGDLVSRESLVRRLWSHPVRDRQVDVLLSRLRRRIGPAADEVLEPVRGLGYRLRVPPNA
jgi:DNA-binding response OmpR family regulator